MLRGYLGRVFDIRGGGLDRRFPHHENGLAQSVVAGDKFVRYWVYNGLVTTNGRKVAKSVDNTISADKVLRPVSPAALYFYLLSAHYRSMLDYRQQALTDAHRSVSTMLSALGVADDILDATTHNSAETTVAALVNIMPVQRTRFHCSQPYPRRVGCRRSRHRRHRRGQPMEEKMTPQNRAADQKTLEEPRSRAKQEADDSQEVSRIGLGLAALGRPAYLTAGRSDALGAPGDRSVEAMRTRTFEVLDAAWQLGIRFIDVAPSYGHAEDFLGAWLASHPTRRPALTISSKWGYEYVAAWDPKATVHERKEHSLAMLQKQLPQTRSALGGIPNFYLVHSVTPESPALRDPALLARLRAVADDGTQVGLSTSGPHQAHSIDIALNLPSSPFSVVQTTWNILERSAQRSLAAAADHGWTVIVKEAMANGRLAPGGTPEVDRLAVAAGATSDALAIGAALAEGWAHVVLSGAVTAAQLESNTRARPQSLDTAELDRLAIPADRYWAERAERAWS